MKAFIYLMILGLGFSTRAENWGSVDLRLAKGESLRIELVSAVGKGEFAALQVRSKARGNYRVRLTKAQFTEATAWLRYHYLHEQELRNKRKERTGCADRAGALVIEPRLVRIELCRSVARHHVLALETAEYFGKYLNARAVASAGN